MTITIFMIELSQIRDLITIFGVIAGFSYYVLTVRNTNKARKTQVVWNLSNTLNSELIMRNYITLLSMQWEDFDDFHNKYDSTNNPEHFAVRWYSWKFFDNMGYMLYQKIVDIDMVYYLISGLSIIQFWEKFESIIYEQRKLYNDPGWFQWWEYLYKEAQKYQKTHKLEGNLNKDVYTKEFNLLN